MQAKLTIQLVLVVLLLATAVPFSTYGADGQRKITQTPSTTFPITINQSGSYVLARNIVLENQNTTAIEITVNDVTLDLNGHTIQGLGAGYGIRAFNQYNLSIENGRVQGFNTGISLVNDLILSGKGSGHRIEGIQTANNLVGIIVSAGMVNNCITNNNDVTGILAINSIISNCTMNNNGQDGIQSENSTVTYCAINYNGQHGINAQGQSHIEGNNLRNNEKNGLSLSSAGGDYAIQNVASDNSDGNFYGGGGKNYLPLSGSNANYGF